MTAGLTIETERLILRSWTQADRAPLAAMLADPQVMHDHPAPLSRAQSEAKLARYQSAIEKLGFGRLAVQAKGGAFLGYVGIMPIPPQHAALGSGVEIGWRLNRTAWGQGFATEAARAALAHSFHHCGFGEVLSYTSPDNARSLAVMMRLGLSREPHRDFAYQVEGAPYEVVVFAARPEHL